MAATMIVATIATMTGDTHSKTLASTTTVKEFVTLAAQLCKVQDETTMTVIIGAKPLSSFNRDGTIAQFVGAEGNKFRALCGMRLKGGNADCIVL